MIKIFVLDTNVLLYDPCALFRFEENNVIIPITVIEEIGRFVKDEDETGRNAREVSRFIDDIRRMGLLSEGVPLENGGNLRIKMYKEDLMKRLPPELREERGDNRILAVAVDLKETENAPVILVSMDTSLRVKADVVGLIAEDYEFDKIVVGPITKSIEFDEDAYQAGVSILGYFSTVVKQKYPDTKVKIKIEQEGTTVRLIINTPEGDRELIEKTLEDYGQVVVGEMKPAELLPDKIHEMQLRHKLDLAVMEVSHTKELLDFAQKSHKKEITHLTEEVNLLKEQIRAALKREDNAKEVMIKIIDHHSIQGEVKDAILYLADLIGQNVQLKDKDVVLELISIIKSNNSPAFEDIKAYLISSFGGASGNLLSSWLPTLVAAIAK